jgi:hypothetical protein
MGQDTLPCPNALQSRLLAEGANDPRAIQRFTLALEALVCPDVDAWLDEQPANRAFCRTFKAIGTW